MRKTLLLWDIDGTMVGSSGAGMRALQAGLLKAFGINGLLDDIDFAGRTDRWIVERVFAKFGLAASAENEARYLDAYLACLPGELAAASARVLPGVQALLDAAEADASVAQGLLTGNIRRGAQVKLGHHGLWRYFAFGAFADDSPLRNELGPHALRRAREHLGAEVAAADAWIIGDTPHDIACARVVGANVLAVATGHHSAAELAEHRPDALLEDLSDAEAFWRAIKQPAS